VKARRRALLWSARKASNDGTSESSSDVSRDLRGGGTTNSWSFMTRGMQLTEQPSSSSRSSVGLKTRGWNTWSSSLDSLQVQQLCLSLGGGRAHLSPSTERTPHLGESTKASSAPSEMTGTSCRSSGTCPESESGDAECSRSKEWHSAAVDADSLVNFRCRHSAASGSGEQSRTPRTSILPAHSRIFAARGERASAILAKKWPC